MALWHLAAAGGAVYVVTAFLMKPKETGSFYATIASVGRVWVKEFSDGSQEVLLLKPDGTAGPVITVAYKVPRP